VADIFCEPHKTKNPHRNPTLLYRHLAHTYQAISKKTNKQTNKQPNKQTNKQTNKQKNKQTNKQIAINSSNYHP
jgi:hypothetical protein